MEAWCTHLPKVELHAHLNGSLRRETLQEMYFKKFGTHLQLSANNMDECFSMFDTIYKTIDNLHQIKRITSEMIIDFANENVKYLEIRTNPKAFLGSSKRDYVETVLGVIEECKAQGLDIVVKLLLSINRTEPIANAEDTIQLAAAYVGKGVVGLDFSGNPKIGHFRDFIPAFTLAREKYNLPITVHYAEIRDDEECWDILSFRPSRLGHGCYLNPEIVAKMRELLIPLEICITSNVIGTQSSYVKHHFKDFYEIGYPLSLATDDTCVFGINLSHEYLKVATEFNLNKSELFSLSYGAIDHIFGTPQEKQNLKEKFNVYTLLQGLT